jgi:hypothetical protein
MPPASPLKMERRMAMLFLLALALMVWQALRTKPVLQPDFEIATKGGEQLTPVAVPSWRPPLAPPRALPERFAFLSSRAALWPAAERSRDELPDCKVFVRISSQHWALRPASRPQVQRWLERPAGAAAEMPWRRLYLPVESFLNDLNGDGDSLDEGELQAAAPGAEVEVFCGEVARPPGAPS